MLRLQSGDNGTRGAVSPRTAETGAVPESVGSSGFSLRLKSPDVMKAEVERKDAPEEKLFTDAQMSCLLSFGGLRAQERLLLLESAPKSREKDELVEELHKFADTSRVTAGSLLKTYLYGVAVMGGGTVGMWTLFITKWVSEQYALLGPMLVVLPTMFYMLTLNWRAINKMQALPRILARVDHLY